MSENQNAEEKRRYERFRSGLQVKFRGIGQTEKSTLIKQGGYGTPDAFKPQLPELQEFQKVVTEDVSLGGMRVNTSTPLPQGSDLWVQISIPKVPMQVNAIAKVMWTRRAGSLCSSGLKFEAISQGDLKKVEDFLKTEKTEGK